MNILLDLFFTFAKIGGFTFGGGYAMISLLDYECVEKKNWLTSEELMDLTVIAESTPGPIAINCATYIGYRQAGLIGALVTTLGIVLPSFIIIFIISSFFENLLDYQPVINVFKGIRIGVSILIVQAGIRMTRKMMKTTSHRLMNLAFTLGFFLLILLLNLLQIDFSTIYLIMISGLLGYSIYFLGRRKGDIK